MRFVNKGKGQPYFWIEDYTPEEKMFFEQIGFKEKKFGPDVIFPTKNNPQASAQIKNLIFTGSGMFGFWTKEEMSKIINRDGFVSINDLNRISKPIYSPLFRDYYCPCQRLPVTFNLVNINA